MKLYHGTPEHNARSIEEGGFLGSELSEFTDGFSHIDNGVVFLTDNIDEAAKYGEAVFEIHPEGVEVNEFKDGWNKHYYANAQEINEQSWWERVK